MRPDRPALIGELAEAVPAETEQLVAMRAVRPLLDPRPGHGHLAADPVGWREDGAGRAVAGEHGRPQLERRAVGVVEGERNRAAVRRIRDRPGERGGPVAAPLEPGELLVEELGAHRELARPAVADRVVTENEDVPHWCGKTSPVGPDRVLRPEPNLPIEKPWPS